MWLNEGFATWSEWRWTQARGGISTAAQTRQILRLSKSREALWDPPPAAIPGPKELFANSVYVRGGVALEKLRERIGDDAFYATLRAWAQQHAYSTATIDEFIALAEAQSGQQLDDLFSKYLFKPGKP
jgi:aminopeptidase N